MRSEDDAGRGTTADDARGHQLGRSFSMADGFALLDPVAHTFITDADVRTWRDADQR